LTAAYRIPGTGPLTAGLAPLVRLAFVADDPPPSATARGGVAFVNPLFGLAYAAKLGHGIRVNTFFGMTLPVGAGGGDTPSPGSSNARVKGLNARAQLDNALFAVNDLTLIPGFGLAYVGGGFTVQLEATLLHLMRVRGSSVQAEASKTNLTLGAHVGYFVVEYLSIGAELRYQRWLNAPFAVERDATGRSRDNLTLAVGPRVHFSLGGLKVRPGVSYQRGIDKPLAAATPNYHLVQFDLPVFF
jgi:opacity protein-like surface antigen